MPTSIAHLQTQAQQQAAVQRTVRKLLWVLLGMVLFTIALVPLYDVFCEITGINGKTKQAPEFNLENQFTASGREVDFQFVTQVGAGLPVQFNTVSRQQASRLGTKHQVMFRFQNVSDQAVTIRTVPSVSPPEASQHVLKIECFCFEKMTLAAHESVDVALIYLLATAIPEHVQRMTLAYTVYPVTEEEAAL